MSQRTRAKKKEEEGRKKESKFLFSTLAVLSETDLGSSLSEALSAQVQAILSDDGALVSAASARSTALGSSLVVRVNEMVVAHGETEGGERICKSGRTRTVRGEESRGTKRTRKESGNKEAGKGPLSRKQDEKKPPSGASQRKPRSPGEKKAQESLFPALTAPSRTARSSANAVHTKLLDANGVSAARSSPLGRRRRGLLLLPLGKSAHSPHLKLHLT